MAIRFIDTNFYSSPFVRGLEGAMKGLYTLIICQSSGAGIWTRDFEIAQVYTGFKISEKQFNDSFVKTGKAIDLKNGKFFFPDFIEHQYPKGLQEKNPAHNNVILELKKYNLIDRNLKVINKGVESPLEGSIDIVIDIEEVKDKVMVKQSQEIIYPFTSDNFMFWWETWLKYRKEIKKPYKSNLSLQAALKGLSSYSEEQACKMIEESIKNQWQGIFELKTNNNGKHTTTKTELATDAYRILQESKKRQG